MSPVGRCLRCEHCSLSFDFPEGARYGAIAKQFESHLCSSSIVEAKQRRVKTEVSFELEANDLWPVVPAENAQSRL